MREKIKSGSVDEIKSSTEELQKAMYDISTKLYQKVNPNQNAAGQPGAEGQTGEAQNGSENVYNAEMQKYAKQDNIEYIHNILLDKNGLFDKGT